MTAAAATFENHLRDAYPVGRGKEVLAITEASCFRVSAETACLTASLPGTGAKEDYLDALAGLGLARPEAIFARLVGLGILKEKTRRTWKELLRAFLLPRFRLLSASFQEKALRRLRVSEARLGAALRVLAWPAGLGALWGLALLAAGPARALPGAASAGADGPRVFLLVLASALAHELGHSFAAAAAGIGLRPIGFSTYLLYPVFYTNVSGMDRLGLKDRAAIDCGGFLLQSLFLLGLLLSALLTGSASAAEAARWVMIMMLFNSNPLFRTDVHWLYKDAYSELKGRRWMRAAHYAYVAAFALFSAYFLWFVLIRLGSVWIGVKALARSPSWLFHGGAKALFAPYFIAIALDGSVQRFREGRQEWKELREAGRRTT